MNPATLFQISYGLYVLSAKEGERDNACIINTVMQDRHSKASGDSGK